MTSTRRGVGRAHTTSSSRVTSATPSSRGQRRPRSILEHGANGVLAVHSISKRSNLAGFRAGFYAGDEEIVALPAHSFASTPDSWCPDRSRRRRDRLRRRRARATSNARATSSRLELLESTRLTRPRASHAPMPEGSFYLWCSKAGLDGWDARDAARRTFGTRGRAPVSSTATDGRDFVRIAVVQPDERLELAASTPQGLLTLKVR